MNIRRIISENGNSYLVYICSISVKSRRSELSLGKFLWNGESRTGISINSLCLCCRYSLIIFSGVCRRIARLIENMVILNAILRLAVRFCEDLQRGEDEYTVNNGTMKKERYKRVTPSCCCGCKVRWLDP